MKKERLFYLDFIRALSILIIVIYHFNCTLVDFDLNFNFMLLYENNLVSWGVIGVKLFFVISGAALMYQYKEKINTIQFYKKRLFSLYPMFWISYIVVFVFRFIILKLPLPEASPLFFIFTFLGLDGYLNNAFVTFYLLGEWFLGVIIVFYLIFPLLRKLIIKYPVHLFITTFLLSVALTYYNILIIPSHLSITVNLFSFVLGMFYIEYRERFDKPLIISTISVSLIMLIIPQFQNKVFLSSLIAWGLFAILVNVSKYIKTKKFISFLSKYSYGIFLTHHVIMYQFLSYFKGHDLSDLVILLLFVVLFIIILISSIILYRLSKWITDKIVFSKS